MAQPAPVLAAQHHVDPEVIDGRLQELILNARSVAACRLPAAALLPPTPPRRPREARWRRRAGCRPPHPYPRRHLAALAKRGGDGVPAAGRRNLTLVHISARLASGKALRESTSAPTAPRRHLPRSRATRGCRPHAWRGDTTPPKRSEVEAAGVEPASEDPSGCISTCVPDNLLSAHQAAIGSLLMHVFRFVSFIAHERCDEPV